MARRLAATILIFLLAGIAVASDWPQWRGPERTGVSKETGLLKSWPKTGPKLLWTFKDAGVGWSSFAVVGGKIYTLGTRDDTEVVIALGKDGKELWTAKIGPIFSYQNWGDGPRSTPTVSGNLLYALSGTGELICVNIAEKGKEVWRKNLIKDFGGEMMTEWGYSESPLVDGDLLICTPGGNQGTLLALEKDTGKPRWRSKDLTQKAPYSSIMPADIHGVRQYIQTSYINDVKGGQVHGIRAKDGALLWSMPMFKGQSYAICPTPIVKDNLVYVTSGYGGGCHLFELDKAFKATELFDRENQKAVKNTHGGVVLIDGYIYGHSEDVGWICQEMKKPGEVLWDERDELETDSGAITAADGMLYLLTEKGKVGLVEANPKEFKLVGSFDLPERSTLQKTRPTNRKSKVWAHPVIADGRLYVRDHELVFCFEVKK